jgi:tight adherence protein B
MDWMIVILLFIAVVAVIQGILFLLRKKWDPDLKAIRQRLDEYTEVSYKQGNIDITRKERRLSRIPRLHEIFSKVPLLKRYDKLVMQADAAQPLGVFVLIAPLLFFAGYMCAVLVTKVVLLALLTGVAAGYVPTFYLLTKRKKRMKRFEGQLPDALDLMARSLHAGHAFSGGLQTVAEEFGPPIGTEFRRVMNEINYGVPADQALKNLTERVEIDDLKFFTVSVIIHRESGGNLAEILENIATLIRERFKLHGKIRVLSAEGRLSAGILVALPFVVAVVIFLLNPEYVRILATDPFGRVLVMLALLMMGLGIFVVKKTITIKV